MQASSIFVESTKMQDSSGGSTHSGPRITGRRIWRYRWRAEPEVRVQLFAWRNRRMSPPIWRLHGGFGGHELSSWAHGPWRAGPCAKKRAGQALVHPFTPAAAANDGYEFGAAIRRGTRFPFSRQELLRRCAQ
jgi:hypothetical protein